MYKVGDCIVYPMHGAGVIENIEIKDILGESQEYYILKIPVGNMLAMLPISCCEKLGVRPICKSSDIDELLSYIETNVDDSSETWNRRYRDNLEKIKSGNINKVAEVIKYLMIRNEEKSLSSGEKKIFSHAKQILYSEIILSKNISYDDADELIRERIIK